jgi:hypothetical protein
MGRVLGKRFLSIDGLRGYLALFVFFHHASIWYFYLRSNSWEAPQQNLLNQIGQSSVALFFMITSFLFFSKLLNAKERPINWNQLFLSRFLRIAPLYLFMVGLVFLLVGIQTHWSIRVDSHTFYLSLLRWLSLQIGGLGTPDINGFKDAWLMTAGVTWTLPYEWGFYFMLPVLGLALNIRVPKIYLSLVSISVAWFYFTQPSLVILFAFLGGIVAAYLNQTSFKSFASSKLASITIIFLLWLNVYLYHDAWHFSHIILLGFVFNLIACGNNLFGLLAHDLSKKLGDISFSIYLLHGILLYITFEFILGIDSSMRLNKFEYGFVVALLTFALLFIASLTYKFIEKPCMMIASTWRLKKFTMPGSWASLKTNFFDRK